MRASESVSDSASARSAAWASIARITPSSAAIATTAARKAMKTRDAALGPVAAAMRLLASAGRDQYDHNRFVPASVAHSTRRTDAAAAT